MSANPLVWKKRVHWHAYEGSTEKLHSAQCTRRMEEFSLNVCAHCLCLGKRERERAKYLRRPDLMRRTPCVFFISWKSPERMEWEESCTAYTKIYTRDSGIVGLKCGAHTHARLALTEQDGNELKRKWLYSAMVGVSADVEFWIPSPFSFYDFLFVFPYDIHWPMFCSIFRAQRKM